MKLEAKLAGMALIGLSIFAPAASAQTVLVGDHSVDGSLCTGDACTNNEVFGNTDLLIKSTTPWLYFQDTSGSEAADRDWAIDITGTAQQEFFGIRDATENNTPFRIIGAAPDNAMVIDDDGDVGIGTGLPGQKLHIVSAGSSPAIRMEFTGGTPSIWDISAGSGGFNLVDSDDSTIPFSVASAAPSDSFKIFESGAIGLGTSLPEAPLHLSRSSSFNFFRITATGAAVNESVDITFTGGPMGTGELRYNIVDGDAEEMKLNANGDMQIDGMLTTAGSCSVGCDAVFDANYALKSIEEHQAAMWAQGYLPNIGPTPEDGPFNVSDKMGRLLNELEHAHIYIGQQQEVIASLLDTQNALLARVDALEMNEGN